MMHSHDSRKWLIVVGCLLVVALALGLSDVTGSAQARDAVVFVAGLVLFVLAGDVLRRAVTAGWGTAKDPARRRGTRAAALLGVGGLAVVVAYAVSQLLPGSDREVPPIDTGQPTRDVAIDANPPPEFDRDFDFFDDPDEVFFGEPPGTPGAETPGLSDLPPAITSFFMQVAPTGDDEVLRVIETIRLTLPEANFAGTLQLIRDQPSEEAGLIRQEVTIRPLDQAGRIGTPTWQTPSENLPSVRIQDDASTIEIEFPDGRVWPVRICEFGCPDVLVEVTLAQDAFDTADTSEPLRRSSYKGKETIKWTQSSMGPPLDAVSFAYYPGYWRRVPMASDMLSDVFKAGGGIGALIGLFRKRIQKFVVDPVRDAWKRRFKPKEKKPSLFPPDKF
jgi:hypothetical protein